MDLSFVLVHYRTPALVPPAVAAVVEAARSAAVRAEVLVVDNGSREEERTGWEDLPIERLDPGENLGYAGGVNLGVERARGERLVVLNPDVALLPDALAPLLGALDGGAAVAGPLFHLDRGLRLLQPPTERRDAASELLAALATRGPLWARLARARWRRHARRHWTAGSPLASRSLSGALLAFGRDTWEAAGRFDAGFPLYFEETDWLERVAARGLDCRFVPAARAVHLYGRSTAAEPRAAGWFESSRRRFRLRRLGRRLTGLLERLERPADWPEGVRPTPGLRLARPPEPRGEVLWGELSASPLGFPAAAERLEAAGGVWEVPREVAESLAPGRYRLVLTDGRGRELACRVAEVSSGADAAEAGARAGTRGAGGTGEGAGTGAAAGAGNGAGIGTAAGAGTGSGAEGGG